METVGYGPTLNKRGGDIQCDQVARYDGEQLVSFVGNKVGTKGEGRREPLSCSLRRGGPIGKVLVHRGSPKCYQQSWQLVRSSSTLKCLHKQTIITAQISYIKRKIKQTIGREKVMTHKYQCIPFQGKAYEDIHDQVCIGRESKEVVNDNTNHQGERMVFLVINSIDTWEKTKCWWWPRHIMSTGFKRMHSNSNDIKWKEWWSKRYAVFSVDNNPEPMEWLGHGKVLFRQNSFDVVQSYDILEIQEGNTRR